MSERVDVSVVMSTYNGAAVLPEALDSIVNQVAHDLAYEVIVVDNNSNDGTRAVIESYAARHPRLRYVFEPRQGVSYGRNAGIVQAQGPILAFFDDDVFVSPDWLTTIKATMDEHPEAGFIGGKVLPEWQAAPPDWLTDAHWSPLALIDYGPRPLSVNSEQQVCVVSANLAVRRSLFDEVGLFSPDLQRVKDSIGSMEDHELLTRFWRAGRRGLYVPNLIVRTRVPPARLTKKYHRRWHQGHGMFCAMMRFVDNTDQDGRYTDGSSPKDAVTLFGVPAFLYRQIAEEGRKWMIASLRRRSDLSFMYENNVRFLVSYIKTRYRDETTRRPRSPVAEVGSFANKLFRKKVRATMAAVQKRSA
jgi:glycosyltransferase involved in cell wall biosynthesis